MTRAPNVWNRLAALVGDDTMNGQMLFHRVMTAAQTSVAFFTWKGLHELLSGIYDLARGDVNSKLDRLQVAANGLLGCE